MKKTKAQAGKLGGIATVEKHGREYMREIGRKGAQVTNQRYRLVPAGASGWLMVNRETNEVRATIGRTSF